MAIDRIPDEIKKRRRLYNIIFAVIAAAFAMATVHTRYNPFAIFVNGGNFIDFAIYDLYPPDFGKAFGIWDALLQTIAMAVIATFAGGLISFCLCFFASYQTAPRPFFVKIVRGLASLQRNIPNTIWLFIFRMTFGIGTAIGLIALLFNTVYRAWI